MFSNCKGTNTNQTSRCQHFICCRLLEKDTVQNVRSVPSSVNMLSSFFSACKPHGSGANFTSFFNFLISLLWIFWLHLKESWSAQGQLVARNCGLWHQISQIFRRLSLFRHLPPPKDANLALSSNWHTSSFSILYIEMENKLIIEGPKLCKLCLCDEKT